MNGLSQRFDFNISADKMDGTSWLIVIGVWLIILACSVGSLFAHRRRHQMTVKQFWFWIALMVGLPVFGVLAYLPFSLVKDGYSILKPRKKDGKKPSSTPR